MEEENSRPLTARDGVSATWDWKNERFVVSPSQEDNWIAIEVAFLPHTYTDINSKWITDLHIRTKSIKILEENIKVNLCDLGLGKAYLDMTPKAQAKENNKLDLKRMKTLCFNGHQ